MDPSYIIMTVISSALFSQGEKNWHQIGLLILFSAIIKYYRAIYDKISLLWKPKLSHIHIYSENDNGNRNIVYSAVMWYIGDKIKSEVIYEQSSVQTDFSRFYTEEMNPKKKFPVYDILYTKSVTDDGLKYSFDFEKISKEKIEYNRYNVTISGNDIEKIKSKIEIITEKYKNYLDNQNKRHIITEGFIIFTFQKTNNYRNDSIWIQKDIHLNKTFGNLFIPSKIKTNIKNSINRLTHDDGYYNKFAVPRKLTILLHGEPGCGKTSLYLTLANEYKMPIYIVKDKETIEKGIKDIPDNSIIVFEEIDTFGIKNRTNVDKNDKDEKDKPYDSKDNLRMILELLDGNYTLPEKSIVILTTNYLNHLDPAVYRKGRVDYLIELEKPNQETIQDIFKYYYDQVNITDDNLKKLDGKLPTCEYTNSILLNLDSQQEAINNLLSMV